MKVASESSAWSGMPSHKQAAKPHIIEDVRFGKAPWVRCACGWEEAAPTHDGIAQAFWRHRREIGQPVRNHGSTHK